MQTKDATLVIAYKNFAASSRVSHIGLGVSGLQNQKVFRSLGLRTVAESVTGPDDLEATIDRNKATHVVVSAPWIPTDRLATLARRYHDSQFYVNLHSNTPFLMADRNGIRLFREAMDLEAGTHNFHLAGNCQRFTDWVRVAYRVPCSLLPNTYFVDGPLHQQHIWSASDGPLRIGSFGATRLLKNLPAAAGAALAIAQELRRPLEFWISGGRTDGGETIPSVVENLIGGLPGVSIKTLGWAPWPTFRKLVGTMHLLLAPSFTESYHVVSADAAAFGVPSIVSASVDWMPDYMKAEPDDLMSIAHAGLRVLHHRNAGNDVYQALVTHNAKAVGAWGKALGLSDLPEYKAPYQPVTVS